MYPNDPVTTAYLSRFHAVERDASAEVRRLAHEARDARPSRRPGSRRHKRVWFRRPGWVVPA